MSYSTCLFISVDIGLPSCTAESRLLCVATTAARTLSFPCPLNNPRAPAYLGSRQLLLQRTAVSSGSITLAARLVHRRLGRLQLGSSPCPSQLSGT